MSSAPSAPQLNAALPDASSTSPRPIRKSSQSARRRELVWRTERNETASLDKIARAFEIFLLISRSPTGLELKYRGGPSPTRSTQRHNRMEITLTPFFARSAIVSYEMCPVCQEKLSFAGTFACICGLDGKSARARPFFLCADFK